MKLQRYSILLLVTILLSGALSVVAEPLKRGPYRAVLRDSSALEALVPAKDGAFEASSRENPVRLNLILEIPGQGTVPVSFTIRKARSWPAFFSDGAERKADRKGVSLFRGTMETRAGGVATGRSRRRMPAAGAVYRDGNGYIFELNFVATGRRNDARFYQVRGPLSFGRARQSLHVRRVPAVVMEGKACGLPHLDAFISAASATVAENVQNGDRPTQAATLRTVEVATDADNVWFQRYGENSNATIASAINTADAIYRAQLDLTFQIKAQNVMKSAASDPYTSINSEALLDQFRSYTLSNRHLGNADIYHLFSRKTLLDNVIGIAFTGDPGVPADGVVCLSPNFSFGLTTDVLPSITFAHEVGHNFDAQHTSSGIMTTSLGNPPPSSFSAVSVNQILAHVNANNSCLAVATGATPTATRTPAATVTPGGPPTAVPTATPTLPGSNNGGNGPSGPEEKRVGLTASLKKSGDLVLTVTWSSFTPGLGCMLTVRGAATSGATYGTGGISLFTGVLQNSQVVFRLDDLEKRTALLNRKGKPNKVFFGAQVDCPTGSATAAPKAVRPGLVGGGARTVSSLGWLRYINSLL